MSESFDSEVTVAAEPNGKKRVRGWLLFLSLCLIILRGLALIVTLLASMAPGETRAIMLLYSVLFAYGLSVGIILLTRAPWAITYAKLYYILQPYAMAGVWLLYLNSDPSAASQAVYAILQSVASSLIWYTYLTFSRRVEQTYSVTDPKRRSPLLAFFMGAALGPLGSIYFNVRVLLLSIIAFLLAIVLAGLAAWILNTALPPWMGYVWLGYYAVVNLVIAFQWNDSLDYPSPDDTPWSTVAVFGTITGVWAFRVIGACAGIYEAIQLFKVGRIFAGILSLILVPALMSWVAGWIMRVLVFLGTLTTAAAARNK